jgi:hypothetical protein
MEVLAGEFVIESCGNIGSELLECFMEYHGRLESNGFISKFIFVNVN